MAPLSALCERSDYKLVRLKSRSYNGGIVKLQSALNDDYNNFLGKPKHVPDFRAHNWKIFPKPCVCTFTSEHFHWFIQRKETLQHFARFWRLFRSVMWSRSILVPFISEFFLPFFSFLILQQLGITFLIKTIILLGLAGYQIIITILALLSYPARPRCTQICVYPRAFMTLRVAQFFLKLAHLSFSMGPRGPRAYGLRPRLWLLVMFLSRTKIRVTESDTDNKA